MRFLKMSWSEEQERFHILLNTNKFYNRNENCNTIEYKAHFSRHHPVAYKTS